MRLYRCDRCKNEYTFNEYHIDDGKLDLRKPNETALFVELPLDLCDDCRKDFENWFRQPMVDKAFEEAHKKAHSHEHNDVTPIVLEDGRLLCPVCGDASFGGPAYKTMMVDGEARCFRVCPDCGILFNDNVNYVNKNKKPKRGDVNEKNTTGTENRVGNDPASPSRKVGDSDNGNQRV